MINTPAAIARHDQLLAQARDAWSATKSVREVLRGDEDDPRGAADLIDAVDAPCGQVELVLSAALSQHALFMLDGYIADHELDEMPEIERTILAAGLTLARRHSDAGFVAAFERWEAAESVDAEADTMLDGIVPCAWRVLAETH